MDIEHRSVGEGPVIVLIHGMQSSMLTFDLIVKPLADKGFRVITYSQRGHGKTSYEGFDYKVSTLASDLKILLDYLGIQRATLLGHSFGAKIAVKFARMFPGRTEKLIIEDMEMIPRDAYNEQVILEKAKKMKTEMPCEFDSEQEVHKVCGETKVILKPNGKYVPRSPPYIGCLYGYYFNIEDQTEDLLILESRNIPILVLSAWRGSAITEAGRRNFLGHDNVVFKRIPESEHNIHKTNTNAFLTELLSFLK